MADWSGPPMRIRCVRPREVVGDEAAIGHGDQSQPEDASAGPLLVGAIMDLSKFIEAARLLTSLKSRPHVDVAQRIMAGYERRF